MNAAPGHPRAALHGITGDNHDRDRMVVSFKMADGTVTRLSVLIKDLEALGELIDWAIPTLAEAWRKRDEAQR